MINGNSMVVRRKVFFCTRLKNSLCAMVTILFIVIKIACFEGCLGCLLSYLKCSCGAVAIVNQLYKNIVERRKYFIKTFNQAFLL